MFSDQSNYARGKRVGLCFGLLVAGTVAFGAISDDQQSDGSAVVLAPTAAFAEQTPDGEKIYANLCSSCHQALGTGVHGVFPPLAGSEWVTGNSGNVIRIILHGLTGEIVVKGETYRGMMPPLGGALKDAEIAAVATYIRRNWGNKASPVATAEVAKVRAATASRKAPWTAKELAPPAKPSSKK